MMHLATASMWVGADATAVIVGVVSSFVWLCVIFSIKPSLRLTWEEGYPGGRWWKRSPSGTWQRCSPRGTWKESPATTTRKCKECQSDNVHYRVEIENLGLAKVVDIEVRLWRITGGGLASRTRIPMAVDQLLELNGKWQESRNRSNSAGNRFFHFLLPCEVSGTRQASNVQFLFQVQAKHSITNFGRVQKLRIAPNPLGAAEIPFDHFSAKDPDARMWRRRGYARIATLIASMAVSKHVHAFKPAGWYHRQRSAPPQTVVLLRCTCEAVDFVSLLGLLNLGPAVPCLDHTGRDRTVTG